MKTTLIKTLKADEGKLYLLKNGRRLSFFVSDIKIELYEEEDRISVLGSRELKIRNLRYSIVVLNGEELDRPKGNEVYSLELDLRRIDNIYERVVLDGLIPIDIYEDKWEFEFKGSIDIERFV